METSDERLARPRLVQLRINVTEWGEGAPVLLLHGNPDSGMMWDGVARRLGTCFRCFAPDLPGFGHSEVPNDYDPSLVGLVRFVEQFLGAAKIKRPIDVVAHDFGGPFGFAWAVRHADWFAASWRSTPCSLATTIGIFGREFGALPFWVNFRWR